jgi:hypothetical protein
MTDTVPIPRRIYDGTVAKIEELKTQLAAARAENAAVKESLTVAEEQRDDALNNLDDARQALLVIADGRLEVELSGVKRHALREVEIARALDAKEER